MEDDAPERKDRPGQSCLTRSSVSYYPAPLERAADAGDVLELILKVRALHPTLRVPASSRPPLAPSHVASQMERSKTRKWRTNIEEHTM